MFDLFSLNYFTHVPVNGVVESGEPLEHGREITYSLDTSEKEQGEGLWEALSMGCRRGIARN